MTLTVVPAITTGHRPTRILTRPVPAAHPLPMPALAAHAAGGMRYGLATVDLHGRVADRALLGTLGWIHGQRVTLTVVIESIRAVADPHGAVRIGSTGHLRLPAGLRRRCGLTTGDRVLLVVDHDTRVLVLHPPAALDALLGGHHATVLGETTP